MQRSESLKVVARGATRLIVLRGVIRIIVLMGVTRVIVFRGVKITKVKVRDGLIIRATCVIGVES